MSCTESSSLVGQLQDAAENGITSVMAQLLVIASAEDVNVQNSNGWTALMFACDGGHVKTVQQLLDHPGTAIYLQSKNGRTALMLASAHGHIETVTVLLAHRDSRGVNAQNKDGWTALMAAAKHGHTQTVGMLLSHPGIDVNLQNENGWTALMAAVQYGHVDTLKRLLAHPSIDIRIKNKDGNNAAKLAETKEITYLLAPHLMSHSKRLQHTMRAMFGRRTFSATKVTGRAAERSPLQSEPSAPIENSVEQTVKKKMEINMDEKLKHSDTFCTDVLVRSKEVEVTAVDRAALDSFLQSSHIDRLNEVMLRVSAHDRALKLLVNKSKECPSLFWFYPKKRELRNWMGDPFKCLFQDSLMMVAVCPVTLCVVKCGPQGVGWEITAPRTWVKKWGPAILFSIYVMQAAVLAGRVVGIPLPQLPSVGVITNALGLNADVLTAGVNSAVHQQQIMNSFSTFTGTTVSVLGENGASTKSLRSKMRLQQQQSRCKKKSDTSSTDDEVVLGADMPTEMFDESYKSIHTFLTTGENANLGSLEDQLRGSMERVLAEDGDVEWVSVNAVNAWKQTHAIMRVELAPEWTSNPSRINTSVEVGAVAVPEQVVVARSWLAAWLRLHGCREEQIADCERKLVFNEGISRECDFAALSSEQFNTAYLQRIGITALGLQQKLLSLRKLLVAQYHPSAISPRPVVSTFDSPRHPSSFTRGEKSDWEKRLSTMEASSNKNAAHLPTAEATRAKGGLCGGSLQQSLLQRSATTTNPRTLQPYTMNELLAAIHTLESNVGTLATDMDVMKEDQRSAPVRAV